MSKSTYVAGEYRVSADWAQAGCPVEGVGYGQYQVADFRHWPSAAIRQAAEDDGLSEDAIDALVEDMKTLLESQIDDHAWDDEWDDGSEHLAIDGKDWFRWSDSDDELTAIDCDAAILWLDEHDCDAANEFRAHVLSEHCSRGLATESHTAQWIESSEQITLDLPTYAYKLGSGKVAMWSDTDEAGIADVTIVDADDDLAEQVREYAEDLASNLGDLIETE